MPNNFKDIISRLEQQKATIDTAIAALTEFGSGDTPEETPRKLGRPAKAATKAVKKRVMSEEGRKRIAAASKKRWAAVRKAAKKTA
jgi:6-phosphogluconate dehydrogenase